MAADFARKNKLLLIVDISQSAGCIPVDVDGWNADAVAFLQGTKSLHWNPGNRRVLYQRGHFPETIKIRRYRAKQSAAHLWKMVITNMKWEHRIFRELQGFLQGLSIYSKQGWTGYRKRRNAYGAIV